MATRRRPALKPWNWGFITPLLVVLVATTIVPLVYTVALSLTESNDALTPAPTGIQNYQSVFTDSAIWTALALAAVFLVGALALELGLGIVTALILDHFVPRANVLRVVLLWPAVLPPIAVALVFKYILQGDIGMVSHYLDLWFGYQQEWLTQPVSAMAVIIAIDVWQYTPLVILLTLAALKTVPEEVFEASALDGAGTVRTAWNVVLPIMQPALISVALLRFIDAIQVFPTIYALTRGGPGSSTALLTYYNFQVFFGQLRFGDGAAISVFVVAFTIACVLLLMQWQRRAEDLA
ncbi:MAG: carbohydrate ABC transporter permease [Beutenbergiaceae bacterium]